LRQRDPGADADLEDAAADPLGGGDGGETPALEHLRENEIVDRRPARVGLRDGPHIEIGFGERAHAWIPSVVAMSAGLSRCLNGFRHRCIANSGSHW
jgi:hypothetical protein